MVGLARRDRGGVTWAVLHRASGGSRHANHLRVGTGYTVCLRNENGVLVRLMRELQRRVHGVPLEGGQSLLGLQRSSHALLISKLVHVDLAAQIRVKRLPQRLELRLGDGFAKDLR